MAFRSVGVFGKFDQSFKDLNNASISIAMNIAWIILCSSKNLLITRKAKEYQEARKKVSLLLGLTGITEFQIDARTLKRLKFMSFAMTLSNKLLNGFGSNDSLFLKIKRKTFHQMFSYLLPRVMTSNPWSWAGLSYPISSHNTTSGMYIVPYEVLFFCPKYFRVIISILLNQNPLKWIDTSQNRPSNTFAKLADSIERITKYFYKNYFSAVVRVAKNESNFKRSFLELLSNFSSCFSTHQYYSRTKRRDVVNYSSPYMIFMQNAEMQIKIEDSINMIVNCTYSGDVKEFLFYKLYIFSKKVYF
jgi:hypothetical protein